MIKCYYAVCPKCKAWGEIEPFHILSYAFIAECPICKLAGHYNELMNVLTHNPSLPGTDKLPTDSIYVELVKY